MKISKCWQFTKCGREPNGNYTHDLGVCPASTAFEADGYCGGRNGGRVCAFISGTLCGGVVQGATVDKGETLS